MIDELQELADDYFDLRRLIIGQFGGIETKIGPPPSQLVSGRPEDSTRRTAPGEQSTQSSLQQLFYALSSLFSATAAVNNLRADVSQLPAQIAALQARVARLASRKRLTQSLRRELPPRDAHGVRLLSRGPHRLLQRLPPEGPRRDGPDHLQRPDDEDPAVLRHPLVPAARELEAAYEFLPTSSRPSRRSTSTSSTGTCGLWRTTTAG